MQNFIMRSCRDWLAWVSIFLFTCMLAGCSALRIGYANGETVLYWWLDGYVDFDSSQKPWVQRDIENLFAWHRTTQLPDYARLFAQAQRELQHPATPAAVLEEYAALKKRAMIVLDRAMPDLADLASSLTPQQIAHLEKKFASNNDKYRKENLRGDLEERQHSRFRKVMKQAEYWFGNFSARQEAQIRAASDARPLDNELWMAERMRRQQELIRILKRIQAEKPGRDAALAMLQAHAAAAFRLFTYDEHKAFFDASAAATANMVALIVNIATPEQKAHAARRLQTLIDDCRSLSATH